MWGFMRGCLLLYLLLAAWKDLRFRTVSLPWAAGLGALALFGHLLTKETSLAWLAGVAPGLLLLLTAWATRQAVGYGDGCVLLVIGLFEGFAGSVGILMAALLLQCPFSLILLLGRKDRQQTLPFVPFLLAAYVWRLFL